jgi:hypothetical protein
MHPEIKKWLKDIELSIKIIHEFFPAQGKYKDCKKDLRTRKAFNGRFFDHNDTLILFRRL